MKRQSFAIAAFILFFTACYPALHSQMITGVWKGKINKQKAEIKIIQNGDNLAGTAYYYESANKYRRYSIKGYFDPNTNEAVWWDDQLLEEKTGSLSSPGKIPLLSRADFNCPGDGRMMLDGKASKVDDPNEKAGDVDLDKISRPNFSDEWDFVIENYTVGANDPDIIDSVSTSSSRRRIAEEEVIVYNKQPAQEIEQPATLPKASSKAEPKIPVLSPPIAPAFKIVSIDEKFKTRKKTFTTEIPVSGDSIELRFYDNAQIDGDSISLFLNDKLIFEHIRLTEKAYTIKFPVAELNISNELVMVAENLGSIPPNTSYMIAEMGEKRYEARLESTEGSSALIRLVKKSL